MGRNAQAQSGQCQAGAQPFKKGGAVHTDMAEDKKIIKKMVKKEALKSKAKK